MEEELLDRCVEGSGIFLIRLIMVNSVLEGFRQRRLDYRQQGVSIYGLQLMAIYYIGSYHRHSV